MRLLFVILLAGLLASVASAQKPRRVSGKAALRMEDAYCIGDARRVVLNDAKFDALAREFGVLMVKGTSSQLSSSQQGNQFSSSSTLQSKDNSLVKGVWLEDEKTELRWELREQELWLVAEVSGKAREIATEGQVAIETGLLRCTEHPEACDTHEFKEGNNLYMRFQSPQDGYLAVYMEEDNQVYQLLPYPAMKGDLLNHLPVAHDEQHILFSSKHGQYLRKEQRRMIEEYTLSTGSKEALFNTVYVIFSPKPFDRPIMQVKDGLQVVSPEKFQEWVSRNLASRNDFQAQRMFFTVSK